jgi:hypothetical protein
MEDMRRKEASHRAAYGADTLGLLCDLACDGVAKRQTPAVEMDKPLAAAGDCPTGKSVIWLSSSA